MSENSNFWKDRRKFSLNNLFLSLPYCLEYSQTSEEVFWFLSVLDLLGISQSLKLSFKHRINKTAIAIEVWDLLSSRSEMVRKDKRRLSQESGQLWSGEGITSKDYLRKWKGSEIHHVYIRCHIFFSYRHAVGVEYSSHWDLELPGCNVPDRN